MKQIYYFIELTRIKKPIGFMLLFWPCLWGLTLGYDFSQNIETFLKYLVLFFLGAVLMRSAGCIVNDVFDKDYDAKVKRTKNRPVASGAISIKLALFYSIVLCFLALIVLIQFNIFTILLAICSMPLAFTYPLMKRFTYWPQLFLGITFNYGLILGWTSVNNGIEALPIIFYIGAIFWTLGYDTIYGYQDIKDDEIIGVKSTSIKFKKNPKKFLIMSYSIFVTSLSFVGWLEDFKIFFYIFLLVAIYQLFYFQINKFKKSNPFKCLTIFKSNNLLGLVIFANILINKLI